MNEHELMNQIRCYVDSKEFEYKFKTWTQKTCKEVISGYWKPIATISSVFVTIISIMFSFIFGHFNHTIEKISTTTEELTKSVIRLENTIDYMSGQSQEIHTKKYKTGKYVYNKE